MDLNGTWSKKNNQHKLTNCIVHPSPPPPPPPPELMLWKKLCHLNLHTSLLMMQLVWFWSHLVKFCSFISSICPFGPFVSPFYIYIFVSIFAKCCLHFRYSSLHIQMLFKTFFQSSLNCIFWVEIFIKLFWDLSLRGTQFDPKSSMDQLRQHSIDISGSMDFHGSWTT